MGFYYQTDIKGTLNLRSPWIDMMVHCIAEAAYFNTFRMVNEYKALVWNRAQA